MDAILNLLTTLFNLALVMVGFGLIIFIHELGHFLAAKWARVRVLAFALGFGPAILSYRRGLGLRRGSSEREYQSILKGSTPDASATPVSPTEYRLNWLPLGGYVKMLGQEDLNPSALSAAPDSYSVCHPLKRMVIISAGVILNIMLAGALFMTVFLIGLERQPPRIGALVPGGAASSVLAANSQGLDLADAVLKPGDRVVLLDGRVPATFDDLILAAAMGRRNTDIPITVRRDGLQHDLEFRIRPAPGMFDGLLDLGIEPYRSNRVYQPRSAADRRAFEQNTRRLGLEGLPPGSRLVSVGSQPVASAHDLDRIVREGDGRPIDLVFETDSDAPSRVTIRIQPVAELQTDVVKGPDNAVFAVEHLLGLAPVMMVEEAGEDSRAFAQGLRTGDVFERIGSVEFPTLEQGMLEIRAHRGQRIDLVLRRPVTPVLAPDEDAPQDDLHAHAHQRITLSASVDRDGRIGFVPGTVAARDTLVGLPPEEVTPMRPGAGPHATAAARVMNRPGIRIAAVDDLPVSTFTQLREALRGRTASAREAGLGASVRLTLDQLMADGSAQRQTVEWTLTPPEVRSLHELAWVPEFGLGVFQLDSFTLEAAGPLDAIRTGVAETHRVMMSTYLTLLRLFQGSVRVEHLKGPVGITHMGTLIAERGVVWLLFFFALVSVNLAVINFLPLPIVDGGQFLMLVYEWIRGRPVPIALQNALTLAGLLLIGSVFVVVTFNDVANLLGG